MSDAEPTLIGWSAERTSDVQEIVLPGGPRMRFGRWAYARAPSIPFADGVVTVGAFSCIAPGCCFICGTGANHPPDANPWAVANHDFGRPTPGPLEVMLGADVHVGMYCLFKAGVTVGAGARIGFGTNVTKDVPPYAVVVGNPGVVKRFRYADPYLMSALLQIRWWDWPDEQVIEAHRAGMFTDVRKFVEMYRQ